MPGDDPDDRLHMAAALAGHAVSIVTWNLADFPAEPLAELGLQVCDPDTYLCRLLNEFPHEVSAVVIRLAAEKRRPPLTVEELVNTFAKAGVATFADQLREVINRFG